MAIPADIRNDVTTRLGVATQGIGRTLKMQHGTTKVFWIDIIVSLRQLEGSAGASSPSETAETFEEALKKHVPAYYDKVADWHRIKTVYERVHPQCIEAMLQFRATHGFGDVPQNWFRQAWARLEQGSSQRTVKQI